MNKKQAEQLAARIETERPSLSVSVQNWNDGESYDVRTADGKVFGTPESWESYKLNRGW